MCGAFINVHVKPNLKKVSFTNHESLITPAISKPTWNIKLTSFQTNLRQHVIVIRVWVQYDSCRISKCVLLFIWILCSISRATITWVLINLINCAFICVTQRGSCTHYGNKYTKDETRFVVRVTNTYPIFHSRVNYIWLIYIYFILIKEKVSANQFVSVFL